jgi:hypothetical protein
MQLLSALHVSRGPLTRGVTGLYGGGMASWWHRDVIAAGKLPLMLCFLAFVVAGGLKRRARGQGLRTAAS